ncbi:MAG TPA: hypothetical protein VFW93_01325 [Aquabacterium sp.]|uniref:hypothetical protein n=1 Tax=Aquabacterium sp. TaxID=1872578 RepID=UPI002E371654|nr:hypothetical protein [Aquabacterium sp.]HEX5354828.1 hypothetical protein [Aquabacterium sp.]
MAVAQTGPFRLSPKRRFELAPRMDEVSMAAAIARRLSPPSSLPAKGFGFPPAVVWTDAGDDILLHLSSLRVVLRSGLIVVSLDLACDQTGREALVMPFSVAASRDQAGLLAVTEELPRGQGLLVGRWGKLLQDAVWAALLSIVQEYAGRLNKLPFGLAAEHGVLSLHVADPAEAALLQRHVLAARAAAPDVATDPVSDSR